MHKEQKTFKKTIPMILFVLAAILLIYGVYMLCYSIQYVQAYQSGSSIAFENALQYVITSTVAYFGFALVLACGAVILLKLQQLQKLLMEKTAILSQADTSSDAPAGVPADASISESLTQGSASERQETETTDCKETQQPSVKEQRSSTEARHPSTEAQAPEKNTVVLRPTPEPLPDDAEYEIIPTSELIHAEVAALQKANYQEDAPEKSETQVDELQEQEEQQDAPSQTPPVLQTEEMTNPEIPEQDTPSETPDDPEGQDREDQETDLAAQEMEAQDQEDRETDLAAQEAKAQDQEDQGEDAEQITEQALADQEVGTAAPSVEPITSSFIKDIFEHKE